MSIKDFDELQHYKQRAWSPPWIKLYNRLLDDYEFLKLSEIAQRHLICLWLLASRNNNRIPNDLAHITIAIHAKSYVDLDEMILAGFVIPTDEPAIRKRKSRKRIQTRADSRVVLEKSYNKSIPDKTREEESREEKKQPSGKPVSWPGEAAEVWKAVAPIPIPRLGRALKPVVDEYGWPDTKKGLEAYIELNRGKTRKIEWFVDDAVRWLDIGRMPAIDQQTGEPTERGRLALRVV